MQRTKLLVVLAVFALTLTSIGQKIFQGNSGTTSAAQYISNSY